MDINKYLKKFDKFTKDPTIEAMKFLLDKFGNPHKKLKFLHIAGTNGKGSVCEMLNRILIDSGYTVGKFLSPQLIRFNDTITVNNIEIEDKEISEILEELSVYIEEYNSTNDIPVKWFEVITSVALIYYAKKKCDFVVLETGLGGTWDCTNVVDSMISIIVSVGMDHVDILGKNISEIAEQKAGIIKKNSDVIYLKRSDDEAVEKVIKAKCKKENSTLYLINPEDCIDYRYDEKMQYFTYKNIKDIPVNLKGKKQIYNSTICIKAVEILREKGYKIDENIMKTALSRVIHRARFETIENNPEIIYDGAHNPPAIENLIKTINQYYKEKQKIFIVSILGTKDYKEIVHDLVKEYSEDTFYFTDGIDEKPFIPKEDLEKVAVETNEKGKYIIASLEDSIKDVKMKYKDSEKVIFIIGSFYIYKKVLEVLSKD